MEWDGMGVGVDGLCPVDPQPGIWCIRAIVPAHMSGDGNAGAGSDYVDAGACDEPNTNRSLGRSFMIFAQQTYPPFIHRARELASSAALVDGIAFDQVRLLRRIYSTNRIADND
jgi:hypothetical protein